MVYNLLTFPVTLLFVGNAFLHLYFAIKLNRRYPKTQNFYNSIIVFLLWIVAGLVYPLFYTRDDEYVQFHESLALNILCVYAPLLIFLFLFFQYNIVLKSNPELRKERTIDNFYKKYNELNPESTDKKYSIKTDLHRKVFHLLPPLIIIILWIFASYAWESILGADEVWGLSGREFGIFIIITIGYTGILLFAAIDYVRLSFIFEKRTIYPLFPRFLSNILARSIKRSEVYDFAKPVGMVLSYVPIFFLPFEIFATAALISTIGDAAASICGIAFGKRRFPKKSHKTIIGYFAGFLASFCVGLFTLWIFGQNLSFLNIVIISSSGAGVFLIIDLLSLRIDDNILNPILSALVMMMVFTVLK
jgi:dolichol kinase